MDNLYGAFLGKKRERDSSHFSFSVALNLVREAERELE